jgi:hypothetical protein
MALNETRRPSATLRLMTGLNFPDIRDWFAAIEDTIRKSSLPENSQLLARFLKLKADVEQKIGESEVEHLESEVRKRVVENCNCLVQAVCEFLDNTPPSQGDLKDEVERIIQQGYFKSIYFRAIVGGLGLVLLLITGVGSFKIYTQVQAMQQMLDAARNEVARGKDEIAKARTETNSRQAELALLLLQGNQDFVKMRTAAMIEMTHAQDAFTAELKDKTTRWTDDLEKKAGPEARQKIVNAGIDGETNTRNATTAAVGQINGILNQNKKALADKLIAALGQIEAAKHPSIPWIVWSISKTWLLVPLAFVVALLAWLTAALSFWKTGKTGRAAKAVVVANATLLVTIVGFSYYVS